MRRTCLFALWVIALVPSQAHGQSKPTSAILAYGQLGGLIPVSKLGPHVSVRLGAGYVLPVLAQRLAVVADLGYSATTTDDTLVDPRLAGGAGADYSYSVTQRDLNLFIGPQGFILDPFSFVVPYAAAGVDLHFLDTRAEGVSGSEALGDNNETSTKVGFALRAGAGIRLGPGLITGEASFAWAPLDHDITGDSHLGRFALLVGYTAMFGL